MARTINEFEHRWNEVAEPFGCSFTRNDLATLLDRLATREPQLKLVA